MADDPKPTSLGGQYSEALIKASRPAPVTPRTVRPGGWAAKATPAPAPTPATATATATPMAPPPNGAPVEVGPSDGPLPGGFVRPLSRVTPGAAGPERNLVDPVGASKALALTDRLPDPVMQADVVSQGYLHDPYHVYKDELIEAQAPRWYENVFKWLEPFDLPRAATWDLAYYAGQALPNPTQEGEQATTLSSAGDLLSWMAGKSAVSYATDATFGVVGDVKRKAARKVYDVLGWPGYDPTKSVGDETHVAVEEVGKKFYKALSTGKLYEAGSNRQKPMDSWGLPFVDIPGSDKWTSPYPQGVDVLDFAAPKELAARAAAETKSLEERAFWTMLTTDAGRETVGLAMEVSVDPLWFVGASSGTKLVTRGDKVYELGRPLVRAIASASELGGGHIDDLAQAAVRLISGTPEEVADARRVFDAAIAASEAAQAQRVAEAARLMRAAEDPASHIAESARVVAEARAGIARMIEEFAATPGAKVQLAAARRGLARIEAEAVRVGSKPGAAKAYLSTMARKASLEGRHLGAAAESMRRGVSFAELAQRGGGVTEAGSLAWHIPFDGVTRYALSAGAGERAAARVSSVMPAPILRVVGEVGAWAERSTDIGAILKTVNAAKVAGREVADVLGPAERFAYAWHLANGSEFMGKVKGAPLAAINLIAQVLGTRHIQPFISRVKTEAEVKLYESAGRTLLSMPVVGKRWVRLERVAPQLWNAYQAAVTGYFRRLSTMEGDLVASGVRISREAKIAFNARQQIARGAIGPARKAEADARAALQAAPLGSPARADRLSDFRRAGRTVLRYERWLSPKYSPLDIMLEAGDLIERGAGLLESRPELARMARAVDELAEKYAEIAGADIEQVSQALANIARFMEGNPGEFDDAAARQAVLLDELRQIDLREVVQRKAVERFAAQHRARVTSLRGLVEVLTPETLATALDRVAAEMQGLPLSKQSERAIENIVIGIAGDRADDVLRMAGVAMGMRPGQAIATMNEMVRAGKQDAVGRAVVDVVTEIAGKQEDAARLAAAAVTEMVARLEGDAEAIEKVASGAFEVGDEAAALVGVLGLQFEKELALLRATVGAKRWPAFLKWAQTRDAAAADDVVRVAQRGAEAAQARKFKNPDKRHLELVRVSTSKLDAAWESSLRVGREGEGGERAKYDKFRAWLGLDPTSSWPRGNGEAVVAPTVSIVDGKVVFNDGRHRFAVLRDMGETTVDVAVEKGKAGEFRKFAPPDVANDLFVAGAGESVQAYERIRAIGEAVAGLMRQAPDELRAGLDELGVKGGKLGQLRDQAILGRRLEEAARAADTEAEAIDMVRKAVTAVIDPTGDAGLYALIEAYATRFGRDLYAQAGARGAQGRMLIAEASRAASGEALRAVRQQGDAVVATARERVAAIAEDARTLTKSELAALRVRMAEVRPRFAPPDGKNTRDLDAWERAMWVEFEDLTKNLTVEDKILAAFSALRYSPEIPQDLGKFYDDLAKAYPRVMGRRLGEVPPELEPVIYELRGLIRSYEDLYLKNGMDFARSTEAMLRTWGVTDYVPHMLAPTERIRTGSFSAGMLADAGDVRATGALDGILSMNMDAARLRTIDGTVREVNAAMTNVSFTLEPTMLVARYLQANRAISAKEFLIGLLRGGVIQQVSAEGGKAAHVVALERDLVPLLRAPNLNIDLELFLRGDRAVWEQAVAEGRIDPAQFSRIVTDLADWTSGLRNKTPGSSFATWIGEVPELQAAANIEEALLRIRMSQFNAGVSLLDPVAEHAKLVAGGLDDLAAWDRVADEIRRVASGQNGVPTDGIRKVSGRNLQAYFEPGKESWGLYVPRAVAQSISDIFDMPPGWDTTAKRMFDKFTTFWKTRVTILSLAFTTRNALSNTITNILDVGLHGALSPKTNFMAAQIAWAATFAEKYGGFERASQMLNAPRAPGETAILYAQRLADLGRFKSTGMEAVLRMGVDLGDGVTRSADDALKLLKENGVVGNSFSGMADIGALESAWSEIVAAGGLGTKLDRAAEWISTAEDVAVVSTSMLLSGGLPVSLGKDIGGKLARFAENQARLVNFVANMRRSGGDVGASAAHVEKFLFNYNDLTAFQRVWVRSFVPFFTWTFKNMELQMDMMAKSPVFYSNFNRMLLVGFPRISQAIDADAEGKPFVATDPNSPDELRLRQPHTLSRIRIPIPKAWVGFKGAYFEGLGLPMEAFAEQMGTMGALLDPDRYSQAASYFDERPFMRFLGQSNFFLKTAIEIASQHHSFYDRPFSKLTNGAFVDQVGNAIGRLPIVGPEMQALLEHSTGLVRVRRMNTHTNELETTAQVLGLGNYLFGSLPWTRVLRDAAAASDLHRRSLAADVSEEMQIANNPDDPYEPVVRDLPYGPRVLDAVSGIQLVQEDAAMRARVYEKRLKEASDRQLEQRGVTREVDRSAVRKR